MKMIKNRGKAESMFCKLFVDAGRALNVPAYGEADSTGLERHHLSSGTLQAIQECEFDDPHFIGGPGAFSFAKSAAQVNRIFEKAEPITTELTGALDREAPSAATLFRANIDEIKVWMLRNSS